MRLTEVSIKSFTFIWFSVIIFGWFLRGKRFSQIAVSVFTLPSLFSPFLFSTAVAKMYDLSSVNFQIDASALWAQVCVKVAFGRLRIDLIDLMEVRLFLISYFLRT